jgi:branched-chain amino acid transport system permease protein
MQRVNLREVFVNASPALLNILTFAGESGEDTGFGTSILYLLGLGAVIGGLAGLIHGLPAGMRRVLLTGLGWVAIIGLLQDLIRVTLSPSPRISEAVSWMFGRGGQKGLSPYGAITVFAVVVSFRYIWSSWGSSVRQRFGDLPPASQRAVRGGSLLLAIIVLFILPSLLGSILSEVANTVGIYILMGLGLNIVVGFAGLLDLGYVAFYAIGAYTMSILTTSSGELAFSFGLNFWEALPIAIGLSLLAGFILGLPVLHVRGDYLAIVTLGFGEIIRLLVLSDFLKPFIGGSRGIVLVARGQIPQISSLCLSSWPETWWPCRQLIFDKPQMLYYLIVIGCLLAAFVAVRLKDSRLGRTWMALREDEDVAQAMGIDLVKTKLLAFAMGAAFSGLAGAIFASKLGSVTPASFGVLVSINALALIIVGGMGSIPGVIVGALALVGLPELLREFSEYRLLVFGAVLVAMMLLRPEGLWPEEARRRELHEQEEPALSEESEAIKEPVIATN